MLELTTGLLSFYREGSIYEMIMLFSTSSVNLCLQVQHNEHIKLKIHLMAVS